MTPVIGTLGGEIQSLGAGLYLEGNGTVRHSTIARNQIDSETDEEVIDGAGAGVWARGNVPGAFETILDHALLADNLITKTFRIANESDVTPEDVSTRIPSGIGPSDPLEITSTFSLIEAGVAPFSATSGNNILNQDALIALLANNGGFVLPDGSTIPTHRLLPDSPAINAGDPALVAGVGDTPAFDQRGVGFPRVLSPPNAIIDTGAFEVGPNDLISADFDIDGDVDGTDFLIWQRGLGTPNAELEDGDADSDQDVDGDDLTVWRDTFGSSFVVAAFASQSPFAEKTADESLYQLAGVTPSLPVRKSTPTGVAARVQPFTPDPAPTPIRWPVTIARIADLDFAEFDASPLDEDQSFTVPEVDEAFARL